MVRGLRVKVMSLQGATATDSVVVSAHGQVSLSATIQRQLQHVGPGIVPGGIEVLTFTAHQGVIQFGQDQAFFADHRLDQPTAVWPGDAGSTIG